MWCVRGNLGFAGDAGGCFSKSVYFAIPSLQENFGIAAVEAMARGVGGNGDTLSDECRRDDAAVLVLPESPQSIANGILEAMQPERAECLTAAQSLVERHLPKLR